MHACLCFSLTYVLKTTPVCVVILRSIHESYLRAMESVTFEPALPLFVCSLACLAAAGLMFHATCRGAVGQAWMWLALCAAAQGWADLMGVLTSQLGESRVWTLLRLAAWAASLAALIEFGRSRDAQERYWLLGRWIYPIVGLATVPTIWIGAEPQLDLAIRVTIAVQGSLLGGFYLWRKVRGGQSAESRDVTIAVVALLNYVLMTGLAIGPLRVLAVVAAVASLWWVRRNALTAEQRGSFARQCRLPAAFVLLVVAGWFVLPGVAGDGYDLDSEQTVAEAFDSGALGGDGEEIGGTSQLLKQLGSCGLALLLPMLFLLIAWGLSRVPAFRQ